LAAEVVYHFSTTPIDPLMSTHEPRLLEVHEVAYLMKCSHESVLRLLRKRKLVGVRLMDRSWRVTVADYDAYVAARRTVTDHGPGAYRGDATVHSLQARSA
jgi:hypothetical protein